MTSKPRTAQKRKSKVPISRTADLLVEIGSEELPWQMIQPAVNQLAQSLTKLLEEQRIGHGAVRVFCTPRRLTVAVMGVSQRQIATSQEVLGPSKSVAFDTQGQPTRAALGFAKSQGLEVAQLEVRDTPKGAYVCAVVRQTAKATSVVLNEHLPQVIEGLTFPKTMRWNASGVRFPRPIRWMVVLLGTTVIKVNVASVPAGKRTWGHRFIGTRSSKSQIDKGLEVKSPGAYEATLERAGVIANPDRRRSEMQKLIKKLAKAAKGDVYPDNEQELLEQAVFSVEYPNILCGKFDRKYLALPQEILITAMKEHQGFFSVVDPKGKLLARFLAPTNMNLSKMDLIRVGNERVLAARLADAQYFFDEDRKRKLADRVNQLAGVVFHKKIGTLYQKTERTISLVGSIAVAAGFPGLKESAQRAGLLSKTDLLTGMVGEFPTLQGLMGRHYAEHDGELEDVYVALGEYYQPRTPDDVIPRSPLGCILSIGDRLDTLAAFFRVGLVPSGSEDPFGLRRQAYGMIRILVEAGISLNLIDCIQQVDRLLAGQGVAQVQTEGQGAEKTLEPLPELIEFVGERMRYYVRTVHDVRDDVVDAVLGGRVKGQLNVLDLFARIQSLQSMTGQADFDPLMVGFKRAHRLVEKEGWHTGEITPSTFEHANEKQLFEALEDSQARISPLIIERNYPGALQVLIGLKSPIDDFLDGVMVNVPEQAIRANRLSLLYRVDQLFLTCGDLSKIQVQGA